jgi:hypothetical protein
MFARNDDAFSTQQTMQPEADGNLRGARSSAFEPLSFVRIQAKLQLADQQIRCAGHRSGNGDHAMTPEQTAFLNLRHFPGVLNREQAALRSGFAPHEIDILSNAGRLTALGKPKKNCKRVFANIEIERCIQDMDWLNRAQRTITDWWDRKNRSRIAKDDSATTSPSSVTSQKSSRSIQKNSVEHERDTQMHAGNQNRKRKHSGGTSSLNGFHVNEHLDPTSPNE